MSHQDASTGHVAAASPAGATDSKHPTMHVKVYSPFKIFYDEPATSISGANSDGPFDILPRHHNFITLLGACELSIVRVDKQAQRIRIGGGVMHVKADEVTVFLDV